MLRPFRTCSREPRRRSLAAPFRVPAEAAGLTAISVTRFPGFATPPLGGCAVSGRCISMTEQLSSDGTSHLSAQRDEFELHPIGLLTRRGHRRRCTSGHGTSDATAYLT